jgi:two-component system LytT family response regulator
VKLEDVVYFKAGDKYISLFIRTGEESITEQSLSQLEEKLPGHFLRVHRAIIINTQFVKEVQTYFNSRYSILMNDYHQSKIITGRNYQTQIKEWLGIDQVK